MTVTIRLLPGNRLDPERIASSLELAINEPHIGNLRLADGSWQEVHVSQVVPGWQEYLIYRTEVWGIWQFFYLFNNLGRQVARSGAFVDFPDVENALQRRGVHWFIRSSTNERS